MNFVVNLRLTRQNKTASQNSILIIILNIHIFKMIKICFKDAI